ncbi:unnamed protein product [Prunus armeniaca]|uniref:Uncharacterized protein n=1 Tax=Prunus armeniaca TaxID=36596 RepID=A0A6J5XZ58_PRUAR|nr:unnamed protein product [Prunus armeniaca]
MELARPQAVMATGQKCADLKMELSKAERLLTNLIGDSTTLCVRFKSRVLAHLYSLPKAKYVPVCTDGDSFTFSNKSCNSQSQPIPKAAAEVNPESGGSKGVLAKLAIDKLKDSKESDESMPIEGEAIEDFSIKSKSERKMESSGNKSWDRDRERGKETETGIE